MAATGCGFGSAETLRRAFLRRLGVPPDHDRRHFATDARHHPDPTRNLPEDAVTTATTARHQRPSWRSAVTNRTFVVHYLQMLAAMLAGMVVLGPLSMLLGDGANAEVQALLMATWMTAGMAAWMAWRRHPWPGILEMGLAMYLAFVVLFPLHWLGLLSTDGLLLFGHVLMLPAMATAMLRRREEYLAAH